MEIVVGLYVVFTVWMLVDFLRKTKHWTDSQWDDYWWRQL